MNFSKRFEIRTDPARLAAVTATRLVGTAPEERFDRLTRLAAETLDVPCTFLSLVGPDSDFFMSASGFPEPLATERTISGETFCHFTLVSDGVLVVEDARNHPLLSGIPTVQSLGVVAYLGVPLLSEDNLPIGAFCAIDMKPRKWSDADIDSLVALARVSLEEIRTGRPATVGSTAELYDSLAPIVYALFLRILGEPKSAADLLGTFMKGLLSRPALDSGLPRDLHAQAAILREARTMALTVRPAGSAAIAERGSENFPASLTDSERRILALAYFDGLKIERIAEIVDAPPLEVRQQLVTAMQKVRTATIFPLSAPA